MGSKPQQQSSLPESSSNQRLDSWKEIASYLKRDERTVRRWEREGLPVHRHMHKKQASIYAFKAEVDDWWNVGRHRLEATERTSAAAKIPTRSEVHPQRRLLWPTFITYALLVAFVIAFNVAGLRERLFRRHDPGNIHSLAVLPLENLSRDHDQEYFADGMTEALTTELAQISALKVISHTSVVQYKGTKKSLPQIAQELSVDAVVEGAVARSGNRVLVSVQLIQATADRHLWAKSYEHDLRDVLALQSELARTIVREIRVKVTPQEEARLANVRSVNPASYEAYIKGVYYFNDGRDHVVERGDKSFQKSVEYLQQAARIDPNYDIAYAQLARAYHWMASSASISNQGELVAQSEVAARKALELNPTLAEAHGALAYVMFVFDRDWAGAEREFRRAIELNPGYGEAHHGYALYLTTMGRLDEAVAEIKKALLLDPLTLQQKTNAAYIYACARQYDRGIEQLRTALALDPNSPEARLDLGNIYIRKGLFEQGIEETQKGAKLTGGDVYSQAELALAYAASGRRGEASSILSHLTQSSKAAVAVDIAAIYALLGDKSNAIAWLEKAAQRDPVAFAGMRCVEPLDSVRADPRVQEMFSRLGLPP